MSDPRLTNRVVDTLGTSGTFRDPLWQVEVALTPLEQRLLRCWWVRRLGFVVHAGAATISSTQSYSRLEHSLGLLALVAHFRPNDQLARAAALLHDVGHLPLSHTFEGVAGLDHHRLGAERIVDLEGILGDHGIEAAAVIDVVEGRQRSALHGSTGGLRLDHLESFVRSGQANGRTRQPPATTLSRLRLLDGAVDTDADTADYLLDLVAAEARSQSSVPNVVATGVMRHLARRLLSDSDPSGRAEVAAMTDHEFWALVLADPRTGATADALRRDPAAWTLQAPGAPADGTPVIEFEVARRYLDRPLVDGRLPPGDATSLADLPALPWRGAIVWTSPLPTRAR